MRSRLSCILLLGAAASTLVGSPADAGIMSTTDPAVTSLATTGPNNLPDFVPVGSLVPVQSPNSADLTNFTFTTTSPRDIVLHSTDSGGTTVYAIGGLIKNKSGVRWTGFAMVLGTGAGAGFQAVLPAAGLSFNTPDVLDGEAIYNIQPGYGTHRLVWEGVIRNNNSNAAFSFGLNLPDSGGGYDFSIRFAPLTPEPASAGLLVLGALALLGRRRRRA